MIDGESGYDPRVKIVKTPMMNKCIAMLGGVEAWRESDVDSMLKERERGMRKVFFSPSKAGNWGMDKFSHGYRVTEVLFPFAQLRSD